MQHPLEAHRIRYALIGLGLGCGLLGLIILLSPYQVILSVANQLAADGSAESFDLRLMMIIKGVVALPTIIALVVSIILVLKPSQSEIAIAEVLKAISAFISNTKKDIRSILVDLSLLPGEKPYIVGLVFVTAFALVFRYVYLWRPMAHDEAYTFVGFATRNLSYIISDYHAPNNHVFHSILTHFNYRLFGSEPWVVRFAAFLAGIAVVPSTYLAARVFYSPPIALISSVVLAYLPVMVDYSTNARGYTLIALFSVLLIPIAAYVKDNKNGFAWFLMILISVLGFYTTPIMLYPAGIIFLWLFLSFIVGDISHLYVRKTFIKYFFLSGLIILGIISLLYLPIILHSGLDELIGNDVVQALSWNEFIASILPRIRSTWAEWSRNLPSISVWTLLIGLGLSIFLPQFPENRRVRLIIPIILWPAIAITIQRVAPWPRIWLFIVPFLVIMMVAGWVGLIDRVTPFLSRRNLWAISVTGLVVVLMLSAGMLRSLSYVTTKMKQPGEVEKAVLFIYEKYPQVQHIYAMSPDLAILDYYLLRYGMSNELTSMDQPKTLKDSFVIINDRYDQTVDLILDKRGFKGEIPEASLKVVYRSDPIRIFAILEGSP